MTALRSGELFAGVGGLGMAVDEVFNAEPSWFCEFDAAPSKVLAHHFPDVHNYGDVRAVDFRTVPHTQIRAGGFPCQDVSLAGRRRGMTDGTRSGLWSEFARSIEEDRPDWVVIENVRGLLSADASSDLEPCPLCVGDNPGHVLRALGAVLGDLADLGFDAEWVGLRASDVGAPHGRFRVFVLAWPRERTVADTIGEPVRGRAGGVSRSASAAEGNGDQRERGGGATGDSGADAPVTLLPTPDAYSGSRGGSQHPEKRRDGGHTVSLADVTEHALLGTPRTAQGVQNDLRNPAVIGNPRGRLEDQIALLPTPNVAMAEGGQTSRSGARKDERLLGGIAADVADGPLLPTPTAGTQSKSTRAMTASKANGRRTGGGQSSPLGLEEAASLVAGHRPEHLPGDDDLPPGSRAVVDALMPTPRATRGGSSTEMSYAMGGTRSDDERPQGVVTPGADWGPYAAAIHRWEQVIGRPAPAPVRHDGKGGKARLNPELTEWMMGWPTGWVTTPAIGLSRAEQLKACGNGVVPQQAAAALRLLLARPGVPALVETMAVTS